VIERAICSNDGRPEPLAVIASRGRCVVARLVRTAAFAAAALAVAACATAAAAIGSGPDKGRIERGGVLFTAKAIGFDRTTCKGSDGGPLVVTKLVFKGTSRGSDPRLTGDFLLRSTMVNSATVDGYVTGTMRVHNPKTGGGFKATFQATTQGMADGSALMDGFIVGTAQKPSMQLFANFTAHGDPVKHTLVGNFGFNGPVAPHNSTVLFSGRCG
jgi:hypothetical protein